MGRALVLLLAAFGLALTGCGSTSSGFADIDDQTDDHGFHGAYLPQPYVVPDVPLTDTDGATYSLAGDARHPLTVVFFGYTNCPDICQIVMSTIASAITRLSESQQRDVEVAFVTTDPERDTLPVLRSYLSRFNPRFVGLTGTLDQIDRLGKPLGVFVKRGEKLPSGGYEVDHSTGVLVIGDKKVPLVWDGATSPAEMAADLIKLLKS